MNEDNDEKRSTTSQKQMTTISQHNFGFSEPGQTNEEAFSISIMENIEEEYGMFVWPCSIVLAEYIWQQRSFFTGKSVLELGAGTSLPGLVAAKVGANVTLTDDSSRLEIMGITWGEWDLPIFNLQPSIILGADVLYDSKDFDNLFTTVTFLLQNTPGSVFITSYHNRSGHHLIEYLMVKWSLKCTKLLDAFSFMPSCKSSTLMGNIQLVEITLDDQQ
ncbi:hypothetical protein MKW92_049571 [Papaver armeniacum]|nr:hypothetical protein MKW92_049571 [Papaver armeniacum]